MLLDHVIISWVFCASYRRDRNLHQVTFRERKQILLLMLSRLLHFAKLCKNNFYPPFSVQISFAQKLRVSSKTEFCQKRSDIFGAADSNLIAHQTRFVPSLIKNWWTGRWSNLKWWLHCIRIYLESSDVFELPRHFALSERTRNTHCDSISRWWLKRICDFVVWIEILYFTKP